MRERSQNKRHTTKRKVFAYITQGSKLLVFAHPNFPEAGIQVPAGTLEQRETPEEGTVREAREETGLQNLSIAHFLGEQMRDMSDFDKPETHHRYFYHLLCGEDTPETWQHTEGSGNRQYVFSFYWVDISHMPELIADHDFYVEKLRALLEEE